MVIFTLMLVYSLAALLANQPVFLETARRNKRLQIGYKKSQGLTNSTLVSNRVMGHKGHDVQLPESDAVRSLQLVP